MSSEEYEEYEDDDEEMIKWLDESYICFNCKTDLYLCNHDTWLCHTCENEKNPAIFEGYPHGGLAPGGVASLLRGQEGANFNPSEFSNSDGRVRLLNGNKQNNRECNLWAIEADMYSSDSLVNQIVNHNPVFLLPYNHKKKLEKKLDGIIYPPIVSLNGRRNIASWQNYSVIPQEWKNSGNWHERNNYLLSSLLSLKKVLFANNNATNVVCMLPFGSGQYSEISWIPRALRSFGSNITDLLFFHIDSNDYNDGNAKGESKFGGN
jgi:hypothetical protein